MNLLAALNDWVKDPWFQLASFAIGIVGIALAILTYTLSRKYKRVWYGVRSFTLVQRERSTVPGLEVLFDRKPVEALTISKLVIWNSGKDTLRAADFPEKEPLRLVVGPKLEILKAFVIQATSSACAANIVRKAKNCFDVVFEFLDPRDGLVIQLAHSGTSSQDVVVIGRIVGGGRIALRDPGERSFRALAGKRPRALRPARVFMTQIVFAAGMIVIAMPWLPWLGSVKTDGLIAPRVMTSFLGLLCMGISWLMYRYRPPKGLERYEDDFSRTRSRDDASPPVIPVAPQFSSRAEAAEWVVKQARVLAGTAEFTVSKPSENQLNLDFGSYWLTLEQLKHIIELGEKNGFKISSKGTGLIFATPEMEKEGVQIVRKP